MTEEYHRYSGTLLISFTVLSISSAISLIVGYHLSNDIASYWPIYLFFLEFIVICYCLIYPLLVANRSIKFSTIYSITYNSILGALLILYTFLRYTIDVDYSAINQGKTQLSLFESVFLNEFAIPCLFITFLIIQFSIYLITLILGKK